MEIILGVIGVIMAMFILTVLRGSPYVPSLPSGISEAFDELYTPTDRDVVVDVGSGDGAVLLNAVRRKARVIGFEINPVLVLVARWRLRKFPNAKVKWADFWVASLPIDTTVIYAFCNERHIERLAEKIGAFANEVGRPVYFVSYGFKLKSRVPVKRNKTSFLYKFDTLHKGKAQV